MLSPVSYHQAEPHHGQRQQEHKQRSPVVQLPHGILEHIASYLPERLLRRHHQPVLPDEVGRELVPDEEVEPRHIQQEVPRAVPLVPERGAQVLGPVALDVVVLHVVVEVAVPRVAHERVQDVGEVEVEPGVALLEHAVSVDVLVHHERIGPRVRDLHDQVQDTVEPGEVVEEQQGRGDRGGEVQDEVGEKHDVRLLADDGLTQADVGLQQAVHRGFEFS